jgi:hypothetical protein
MNHGCLKTCNELFDTSGNPVASRETKKNLRTALHTLQNCSNDMVILFLSSVLALVHGKVSQADASQLC